MIPLIHNIDTFVHRHRIIFFAMAIVVVTILITSTIKDWYDLYTDVNHDNGGIFVETSEDSLLLDRSRALGTRPTEAEKLEILAELNHNPEGLTREQKAEILRSLGN